MLELIPVHNLYWKKYLTFGYHELITLWMDDYGLPVLRECMKFFLEKEEYLDCAKVRDLLEGKLIKTKSKKKKLKTII